jgi:hypothetical protein
MNYPSANWFVQQAISADLDNAGTPALAVGSDESVYFAIPTKSTADPAWYTITVGKLASTGALRWKRTFPELVTSSDNIQPTLVVGASGEVFVAFMTTGSVLDRLNMAYVPNFCSDCSTVSYKDIVLVRIDQPTPTSASLTWYLQDATMNSCADETAPQLAIDSMNQLLYMTWQSTKNIQCYPSIGSNNILLACFGYNGVQKWLEAMGNINATAKTNENPVVAASHYGQVMVAWETKGAVTGGLPPVGKQIEVVSFQTDVGNPTSYSKLWVGSSISNIFANGNSYSPTIASTKEGVLYLAFLTEGVVGGGIRTGSAQDLVTVSLNTHGELRWMRQGPIYNNGSAAYTSASNPYLTLDAWGNPYLSLQTDNSKILLFRFDYNTGNTQWSYNEPPNTYNAYGYALSGAPFSVFPTSAGSYSKAILAIHNKAMYVATTVTSPLTAPGQMRSSPNNDLVITSMKQQLYTSLTPYQYITNNKIICGCSCVC